MLPKQRKSPPGRQVQSRAAPAATTSHPSSLLPSAASRASSQACAGPVFPSTPSSTGVEIQWPAGNPRDRLRSRRRDAAAAPQSDPGTTSPPSSAFDVQAQRAYSSQQMLRPSRSIGMVTQGEPSSSELCVRTSGQVSPPRVPAGPAPGLLPGRRQFLALPTTINEQTVPAHVNTLAAALSSRTATVQSSHMAAVQSPHTAADQSHHRAGTVQSPHMASVQSPHMASVQTPHMASMRSPHMASVQPSRGAAAHSPRTAPAEASGSSLPSKGTGLPEMTKTRFRGAPSTWSQPKLTASQPKRIAITNPKAAPTGPRPHFPYGDPYAIRDPPNDPDFLALQARVRAISKLQLATVELESERKQSRRRRPPSKNSVWARLSSCSSSDMESTRRQLQPQQQQQGGSTSREVHRDAHQAQALNDAQGLLHTLQIQPHRPAAALTTPGGTQAPARRRRSTGIAGPSGSVRQTARRASIADPLCIQRSPATTLAQNPTGAAVHGTGSDHASSDTERGAPRLRRYSSQPLRRSS
eukprot:scpid78588/ scgid26824/ 